MLDIRQLCGVLAVLAAEGLDIDDLHAFLFHRLLEIFLRGHTLLIVMGIEDRCGLVA